MDISAAFTPVSTRPLKILHPGTDEPTGLVLNLRPLTDRKVKKVKHDIQNKRLASRKFKVTSEQLENQTLEIHIACVESWEWNGDSYWGGKKLDFPEENVREVLSNPIVSDQVDADLGDIAGFLEN